MSELKSYFLSPLFDNWLLPGYKVNLGQLEVLREGPSMGNFLRGYLRVVEKDNERPALVFEVDQAATATDHLKTGLSSGCARLSRGVLTVEVSCPCAIPALSGINTGEAWIERVALTLAHYRLREIVLEVRDTVGIERVVAETGARLRSRSPCKFAPECPGVRWVEVKEDK